MKKDGIMNRKNIWFTSDTHFGHSNIINHCNRPFSSCLEMDEELIKRWNAVVKNNDEVYHLGDFCISRNYKKWLMYLSKLNGNIYLIKGNHDKQKIIDEVQKVEDLKYKKFIWVKDYFNLKSQYKGKKIDIILMHYSMRVWNRSHYGVFHLFGHSHGTLNNLGLSMDVGVDTNNFYPYNINNIVDKLQK